MASTQHSSRTDRIQTQINNYERYGKQRLNGMASQITKYDDDNFKYTYLDVRQNSELLNNNILDLTQINDLENKASTPQIKHLNNFSNRRILSQTQTHQALLESKSFLFDKIKEKYKRNNKKTQIDELSKDNPLFLKKMKIKILKLQTTQNSILHQIKNQTTRFDNQGIYINILSRNNFQCDISQIIFEKYNQVNLKSQRSLSLNIQKQEKMSETLLLFNSNKLQAHQSTAIRNTKRKLKASRRIKSNNDGQTLVNEVSTKNQEQKVSSVVLNIDEKFITAGDKSFYVDRTNTNRSSRGDTPSRLSNTQNFRMYRYSAGRHNTDYSKVQ